MFFCFKYIKPHTHKVWTRTWITDTISQTLNSKNVRLYNECLSDLIDDNRKDDSNTNNNNLIIINKLLPDLLKNEPENQKETKKIMNNIINEKQKNIAFLNNYIPLNNGVDKL